ncbi:hypothetical protein FPSM_00557 [Flavobacterium psychrophilum]|nr:hypothetical protein FPSM_00557 [Flavobacterium psychrophilum]
MLYQNLKTKMIQAKPTKNYRQNNTAFGKTSLEDYIIDLF